MGSEDLLRRIVSVIWNGDRLLSGSFGRTGRLRFPSLQTAQVADRCPGDAETGGKNGWECKSASLGCCRDPSYPANLSEVVDKPDEELATGGQRSGQKQLGTMRSKQWPLLGWTGSPLPSGLKAEWRVAFSHRLRSAEPSGRVHSDVSRQRSTERRS